MGAVKAQASLRICADSSEHSLLGNAISTSRLCVGCLHTKLYSWDRSASLVVPSSTSKLCIYMNRQSSDEPVLVAYSIMC